MSLDPKFAEVRQHTITTLSGANGAGLSCACPRCGQGRLFAGFLTLQPRCERCGLDISFADSGDGPAVFIMFLAGAIVVGAALVTEILFQPPYWVHAALWLPLIALVTLGPLRPMKGLMIRSNIITRRRRAGSAKDSSKGWTKGSIKGWTKSKKSHDSPARRQHHSASAGRA